MCHKDWSRSVKLKENLPNGTTTAGKTTSVGNHYRRNSYLHKEFMYLNNLVDFVVHYT